MNVISLATGTIIRTAEKVCTPSDQSTSRINPRPINQEFKSTVV